jgi:hypothetical protein
MQSRRAKRNRNTARDDEEQSRLFIKKPREIGADEEQSRADELIGTLARQPPKPRKKLVYYIKPRLPGDLLISTCSYSFIARKVSSRFYFLVCRKVVFDKKPEGTVVAFFPNQP